MECRFLGAFLTATLLMWLLATLLIIPKSIASYLKWKKNGKTMDLAMAISASVCAFFLLSGVFVTFIKIVIKWANHV